jgi:hypothetical protein
MRIAIWIRPLLAGWLLATGVPAAASGQPVPVADEQVEPGAGAWKTWLLTSPSQIRVPPPPDEISTAAELQQLHATAVEPAALDRIRFWDAGAPGYRWDVIMGDELLSHNLTGATRSRQWSLLATAMYDATIAAWDSK